MKRSGNAKGALGLALSSAIVLTVNAVDADEIAGERVYSRWCAGCHMDSPFAPGTIQLKQTRGPDKALIEQRADLSEAYVRLLVRKGFAGMPLFRRTEITDADLDALVAYLVRH